MPHSSQPSPDFQLPSVSRRSALLLAAAGCLAGCTGSDKPAPKEQQAAGRAGDDSAAPTTTDQSGGADKPALPISQDFGNGAPAGVGMLTYDLSASRDWSDLDRWYTSKGRKRPKFDGKPRIHRVIGGTRNPEQKQLDLDQLLLNGMVLENDPGAPENVIVIAHHNVTRIRNGAVSIDGVIHDQPMLGIHAPEVPGDVFTWMVPRPDGKVAEYDYKALSVEIIDDKDGEYAKLFTPADSGKPLLVTYQCHPAGSLAQRRVVRHELVASRWTNKEIAYV